MVAGGITYMGTKKELAQDVARIVASAQPGIMLDAFAGMGAVAQAVSASRNVWLNDAQQFAQLVGRCNFKSWQKPNQTAIFTDLLSTLFDQGIDRISSSNETLVSCDAALRSVNDWNNFERIYNIIKEINFYPTEYCCFTSLYSRGFFSVRQCIEIDSIRFALDICRDRNFISKDQWNWSLVALGRACLKVANTPGHFAQFLNPSEKNFKRVLKQWNRSVWNEWASGFQSLSPVGTARWRSKNIVTNEDCLELLGKSEAKSARVVYCDPPYTNDHYSRYYHIWETLVAYDYPEVAGAGRYRPDRFATPFSMKAQVVSAMNSLIQKVSANDSDMVLSYPSNGLMHETGVDPLDVLREHFSKVSLECDIDHSHSTFGASKGAAKSVVRERVYFATNR